MTMKTFCLMTLFTSILFITLNAVGYSLTLGWNGTCDTNVIGYKLYYDSSIGTNDMITIGGIDSCGRTYPSYTNTLTSYSNNIVIVGIANTSYSVSNLVPGLTYSFALTCFTGDGDESGFGNEIQYTYSTNYIAPDAPGILNFK